MESNISRPEWLTDERIEQLKKDWLAYPDIDGARAYLKDAEFDGLIDMKKTRSKHAYDVLSKYNIPFDTTAPK